MMTKRELLPEMKVSRPALSMPTMTRYRIHSAAGADMGSYVGRTPAHALAAMHRCAGYDCTVRDSAIVFLDPDDRSMCGDVDHWRIAPER